jgi:hypothetical protein
VLLGVEAVPVAGTGPFTERDILATTTEAALVADVGDYLVRMLESKGASVPEPFVRAVAVTHVPKALADCGGNLDHPRLLRSIAGAIIEFEQKSNLRPGGGR